MLNFQRNGINKDSGTFDLLNFGINPKETAIEIFFIERMEQLLKTGGIGAIIFVLSGEKYRKVRGFILSNFKILSLLLTADITFSGTTTSPVVVIARKQKMNDTNYNILIHKSPKYSSPNETRVREKEIDFLGYEFSSDRNKPNTMIKEKSLLPKLSVMTKTFIAGEQIQIDESLQKYSTIRNLNEILLNINPDKDFSGDIYPKKINAEGAPLSNFCKINEYTEDDFDKVPDKYIEISDIKTQTPNKKKVTKRYCKKGDILVSSLTPRAEQIVIANDDFMLSNAIHVLSSFSSIELRDKVLTALKKGETISQMNALLDGFKVTYGKISETNLYHNVNINMTK